MGKRWPIKLPVWHEKRLIWWATAKATTKTTLAQNILQARIEANEEQIDGMLSDMAKDRRIPLDDLKDQILKENNFNPNEEDGIE